MVGSNKILTVSYGTFSCTLEGFDDSFHSMKAIAEYFRDLAQEDRYFGAEPPAPDVEMLARIAEREISRRVEAEMKGGSVVLRTKAPEDIVADASAKEMPTAGTAPQPAAPVAPTLHVEPEAATAVETAAEIAEEPVVAQADLPEASKAAAEVAEEEATPEVVMPPAAVAAEVDADAAQAFMSTPQKAPTLTVPPAPALYHNEAPAHPDENSVAAKLQRIRAVVSRATIVTPEVEDTEASTPLSFHDDAESEITLEADSDLAKAFAQEDDAAGVAETADQDVDDKATVAEQDVSAGIVAEVADDEDVIAEEAVAVADDVEEIGAEDMAAKADDADEIVAQEPEVEATTAEDSSEVALEIPAQQEAAEPELTVETQETTVEDAGFADDMPEDVLANTVDTSEDVLETSPELDSEVAQDNTDQDVAASEIDESETPEAAWAREALADADVAEESADVFADSDVLEADEADLSTDLNDIDEPTVAVETQDEKSEDAAKSGSLKQRIHARIVRLRKDGMSRAIPVAETDDDVTLDGITAKLKSKSEDAQDTTGEPLVLSDAFETTAAQPETVDPEDKAHDDIRSAIAAAMPAGSLSDEDEEDLQRELAAAVEDVVVLEDETPEVYEEVAIADKTAESDVAEAAPEVPEVIQVQSRGRKKLPEPDYAVTRMIAQTDEALNEPAGSRRRNAIAQLKAAVAATEAARQLGDKSNAAADAQNAFRDDLDQVVRPSRPIETAESDAHQPDRPRASPLKLVASQRVDGAEDEDKRPVTKSMEASEPGGFAKFAASMGATELPDLLEAAAAYTSFVEGIEDFSRPQIMKKVQMTTTEEFSREDGLRSFGTLLRQGRISKVRNGRFQVSEQTRFRPDARSA